MTPNEPKQADTAYLTPGEAATALGVSRDTLVRLARAGRIRSIRPGVHHRYLAADVEALAGRA